MRLRIPFYWQDTSYTCGPASLQMALAFLGDHKSEHRLSKEACTTPERGTDHSGMIASALSEGFYCYVNNDSSVQEIKHFLSLGLPVVVNFMDPRTKDGHYAVVSAVRKNRIILNDPWNGKGYHLNRSTFEKLWHDNTYGRHCEKWIMVISQDRFNTGRQYIPHTKG